VSGARLLLVVPALGHHALTHGVVSTAAQEPDLVDVVVVDNAGDYPPLGSERVLSSRANRGWLESCNLGLRECTLGGYDACVLLNNDVRLSPAFFAGLRGGLAATGAGLLGPVYDDVWSAQRTRYCGEAVAYRPRALHRRVPFVDGTCLVVANETIERVGLLDGTTFGRFGWGADIDYALRARRARLACYVTELSYLNHLGRTTVAGTTPDWHRNARSEMNRGLAVKWGRGWRGLVRGSRVVRPATR
jgi:GT2 family glycosyltransferase